MTDFTQWAECDDTLVGNPVGIRLGQDDRPSIRANVTPFARDLEVLSWDTRRVVGCLLGGAVGDALGARVEFMSWEEIRRGFGERGIRSMAPAYGRRGAITDDTQMMLFTAEGLLRALVRMRDNGSCHIPAVLHHALQRWLITQGVEPRLSASRDGWLMGEQALWSQRAPGNTCLSALTASKDFGTWATNDSKGCGGVMRVAPCAFLFEAFEVAAESARLTHGHPTGYLAAGLFADVLHRLWKQQQPLERAVVDALQEHGGKDGMQETRDILERVLRLHHRQLRPDPAAIARLGGGWVAEEALAIGVWCALAADSLEEGIVLAVNHSGDSDSTGMIAGNILGLIHGPQAIPRVWLDDLELREVITRIAVDLTDIPARYEPLNDEPEQQQIRARYPGW